MGINMNAKTIHFLKKKLKRAEIVDLYGGRWFDLDKYLPNWIKNEDIRAGLAREVSNFIYAIEIIGIRKYIKHIDTRETNRICKRMGWS